MRKESVADIWWDMRSRLLVCWVAMALLVAGCAAPGVTKPALEGAKVTSPDFVAVIAEPGDSWSSLAKKYLGDPSMDWFISDFNETSSLSPGQEVIIPRSPYALGGLNARGYQTVPVLCYHRFSRSEADAMTVTERAFEEQMRYLKEGGYRVITLDELFDFLDFKRQIPKKSVVITIDDGWRSFHDVAAPILKKYDYPATLFLYTDLVLGTDQTLTWDLVRKLSKDGVDIQCHSRTHRNLSEKNEQESFKEYFESINNELTASARIIREKVGKDVRYVAYPYGDTNHLVVAVAAQLGYRGAFTVQRNGNPFFVDPYRVHRSMIMGTYGLRDFEANLATSAGRRLE